LLSAGNFSLDGAVNSSNAVLAGATLQGTGGIIGGDFAWIGGDILDTLTIMSNGIMTVALPDNGSLNFSGDLTNAGTVLLQGNGGLVFNGNYLGLGQLYNLPGGKILTQGSVGLSGAGVGTELVANSGLIEAQNGALLLSLGGPGAGQFIADAGALLNISGNFTINNGGGLTGLGTNWLQGGTLNLNGTVNSSNAVLAGATISANNAVLNGSWTWTSGTVFGTLTVASNAMLQVALTNNGNVVLAADLTNAGSVSIEGQGALQLNGGYGGGQFINLPGAVVAGQGDVGITDAGAGTELFINAGVVEARAGTLTLTSAGVGNGDFLADTGAVLNFATNYNLINGAVLAGDGTNIFSSGQLRLSGSVNSANAVLAGGNLVGGAGAVLTGSWAWNQGDLAGALTLWSNAVLVVAPSGTTNASISGTLTNSGTILLQNGANVFLNGASTGGQLVNSSGGRIDAQGGAGLNQAGYASELLLNQGLFLNESGSNTTHVSARFENQGIVDAESGLLSFDGVYGQTNGTLQFGLSGLQTFGAVNFASTAPLEGTLAFSLNGGYSPNPADSFTLITYPSFNGGFSDTNQAFNFDWQTVVGNRQTVVTALQKVIGAIPPAIVLQPSSTNLVAGQAVILHVGAVGTGPMTYQWRHNGVNLPGAMGASLMFGAAHPSLSGDYSVVVRNVAGTVTSSAAALTVLGVRPLTLGAPAFTGNSRSFSITSQLGLLYVLERKDSLTDSAWTTVQSVVGTGAVLALSDPSPAAPSRFYRIRID